MTMSAQPRKKPADDAQDDRADHRDERGEQADLERGCARRRAAARRRRGRSGRRRRGTCECQVGPIGMPVRLTTSTFLPLTLMTSLMLLVFGPDVRDVVRIDRRQQAEDHDDAGTRRRRPARCSCGAADAARPGAGRCRRACPNRRAGSTSAAQRVVVPAGSADTTMHLLVRPFAVVSTSATRREHHVVHRIEDRVLRSRPGST